MTFKRITLRRMTLSTTKFGRITPFRMILNRMASSTAAYSRMTHIRNRLNRMTNRTTLCRMTHNRRILS